MPGSCEVLDKRIHTAGMGSRLGGLQNNLWSPSQNRQSSRNIKCLNSYPDSSWEAVAKEGAMRVESHVDAWQAHTAMLNARCVQSMEVKAAQAQRL